MFLDNLGLSGDCVVIEGCIDGGLLLIDDFIDFGFVELCWYLYVLVVVL